MAWSLRIFWIMMLRVCNNCTATVVILLLLLKIRTKVAITCFSIKKLHTQVSNNQSLLNSNIRERLMKVDLHLPATVCWDGGSNMQTGWSKSSRQKKWRDFTLHLYTCIALSHHVLISRITKIRYPDLTQRRQDRVDLPILKAQPSIWSFPLDNPVKARRTT